MAKALWKSETELENAVTEFLDDAKETGKPITKLALALHLKITKEQFGEFESGVYDTAKNKFSRVFKMAEMEIERYAEELLLTRDKASNTLMCYLKKNFGWSDDDDNDDNEIKVSVKVV